MRAKLFPRPRLILCLALLWLFLVNSIEPGQILLGLVLGWLVSYGTLQYWPEAARPVRVWLLFRYIGRVLWDIIKANIAVAWLIMGPKARLRPATVDVPLELDDMFALTMLSASITLSPGTVSMSLSPDRRTLRIHALDCADEQGLIDEIKSRYERPLQEIFQC